MDKKFAFAVISAVLLFSPLAFSEVQAPPQGTSVVDVGNKFCPVSGDKVSGKHFVVYQGKRYSLCCPQCEEKFLKNPEKYIAKMAQQEKV